jgi:hypothetical protein
VVPMVFSSKKEEMQVKRLDVLFSMLQIKTEFSKYMGYGPNSALF